ncbi:GTPase/DUF3482 domain-containing protein [Planctomycetota bacterium]|nr:GTPase/DUF3482 domain-containing protein [Planctomycetota bacterium]
MNRLENTTPTPAPKSLPNLVVVGHPNQGKSSIVSTLLQDTTIQIASLPGTTTTSQSYPVQIQGQHLFNLTDTPGFENARKTLAYLQSHDTTADKRLDVIKQFIAEHKSNSSFAHECQILQPIIDGAGILYIVDGSKPYSPSYEAEIEILRWTGRPRMALINPIESSNYITAWQQALSQSFSSTLVFNACFSEFDKHIQLLRTFATIQPDWSTPLNHAADCMTEQRSNRQIEAATIITLALTEMLTTSISKTISQLDDPEPHKQPLKDKLLTKIRDLETTSRNELKSLYNLTTLYIDETDPLTLPDPLTDDIFTESASSIFGLSKSSLITSSAATGAITGGIVDAHTGGTSFLLGTAIGTAIGAGLGFIADQNLAKLDLPLTIQKNIRQNTLTLTAGPIAHINFPHVILSRLLYFHHIIANHNHANRTPITLPSDDNINLTKPAAKDINKFAKQLPKTHGPQKRQALITSLNQTITHLLQNLPIDQANDNTSTTNNIS